MPVMIEWVCGGRLGIGVFEDAGFEFVGAGIDSAADEDEAAVPSETLEDLVIEWGGKRDGLLGKNGGRKSCGHQQREIAEEGREQERHSCEAN